MTRLLTVPLLTLTATISGCLAYGEDEGSGDTQGAEGGDGDGGGDGVLHDLEGDVVLFVNARLTNEEAAFGVHLPFEEQGTYVGNALYLYDPDRECEDGGISCRLVKLGNVKLDETMGDKSVADGSLKKFALVDLAWHPEQGLWALTYDPQNDEWGIASLDVPDWRKSDQLITIDRYTIKPGPQEDPATDPCYWQEAASSLGFVGDELVLGVRGAGSTGTLVNGTAFAVDLDVIRDQGHCIYPADFTQDPVYYACDVVCRPVCDFGARLGIAGDIIPSDVVDGFFAWVRSEDDDVMPLDRNVSFTCEVKEDDVSEAVIGGIILDGIARGTEIEGLARMGDEIIGLTVLGEIWKLSETAGTASPWDDVSSAFPEQGLKLRGATTVTLPPSP